MSRLRDLQREAVAAQVLPSNSLADRTTELLRNPLPHLGPIPQATVRRGLLQRGEQLRPLLLVQHQCAAIVRTSITEPAEPLGVEALHLVADPATRAAEGITDGDEAPAFRHQTDGFDGAADVGVVCTARGSFQFINGQVRLELNAGHRARAAAQHPKVNAAFAGDSVVEYADVNLSVAIAVDDGLITPVVRKADKLSLRDISAAVKDLAVRARNKKIKPEEYAGGTITVSNLGAYGVDSFYAIVNPPQAAILAVGAIVKKPVVGPNDQIIVGHRMSIALSGDHRVVDGALGAQFLAEIRKSLESPATLLF